MMPTGETDGTIARPAGGRRRGSDSGGGDRRVDQATLRVLTSIDTGVGPTMMS
jgi:hypothetical protein